MNDYPADASYERGYDHGHAVGFREAGIKFEAALAASDKRVRELEEALERIASEAGASWIADIARLALSHTKEGEG